MTADWPYVFGAFLMGLAGAGHCLGMCGGLASAIQVQPSLHPVTKSLVHNFGRIGSYTLMGLLLSAGMQFVPSTSWPVARTLVAILMFLLGAYFLGWHKGIAQIERVGQVVWRRVQPLTVTLLPADSYLKVFLFGALWGWLPCGLVYSALAYASVQTTSLAGGLCMLAFGIGTLPAMFLAGASAGGIKRWLQKKHIRASFGLFYIAFAVWTLSSAWYHVVLHSEHGSQSETGSEHHQHHHH